MLLCHFDKRASRIDNSTAHTEFLRRIADSLSQHSESLDPVEKLEPRMLQAINQFQTSEIIREFETTPVPSVNFWSPSFLNGCLVRGKIYLDFQILSPNTKESDRIRLQLQESSKKMASFMPQGDIINLMRTIGQMAKHIIKMEDFPAEELSLRLKKLQKAPKMSRSFFDDAVFSLFNELETWKILVLHMDLFTSNSTAERIIFRRYKSEEARNSLRLSSFTALVYNLQAFLLQGEMNISSKV
jgi:hypothetical protein